MRTNMAQRVLILATILVVSVLAVACGQTHTTTTKPLTSGEGITTYSIEVQFDAEDATYCARQEVVYVNKEKVSLTEVYFHLYPNASGPDTVQLLKVEVDGRSARYAIEGEDDTLLRLDLRESLAPGEPVTIHLSFQTSLPAALERFGYGPTTYNFGNWYPIIAVYEKDGWRLDPYHTIGDPFYSEIANYRVEINLDADLVAAASGDIIWEEISGESKTVVFSGERMRDFAWVASRHFKVSETAVDGIRIKVFSLTANEEYNRFLVDTSRSAVGFFNQSFGLYPYNSYSVVTTDYPSSMEYAGLVMIRPSINSTVTESLEMVLVHETAHQWWYGVVGSDQINEAWLDESLAIYSEKLYFDAVYGNHRGDEFQNKVQTWYYQRRRDIEGPENILTPLGELTSEAAYSALMLKGSMFLHEIELDYGKDSLLRILREHFLRNKFSLATTSEFIALCEEITEHSFDQRVQRWLLWSGEDSGH